MPDSSLAKQESPKWIVGCARFQAGDAAQPFIKNGVPHGLDAQPDIMFKLTNS